MVKDLNLNTMMKAARCDLKFMHFAIDCKTARYENRSFQSGFLFCE